MPRKFYQNLFVSRMFGLDFAIEPDGLNLQQLAFLCLIYGYIISMASNYMAEGAELLLHALGPSWAVIIGGIVVPSLGVVPDGVMMLISGMKGGTQEEVRANLRVSAGVLVGSTILLLTIPTSLGIWFSRRQLGGPEHRAMHKTKVKTRRILNTITGEVENKEVHVVVPCLPKKFSLFDVGGTALSSTPKAAKVMMMTSLSYGFLQIPYFFFHNDKDGGAAHESFFALAGMIVTLLAFCAYLYWAATDKDALEVVAEKQRVFAESFHQVSAAKNVAKILKNTADPFLASDQLFEIFDVNNSGHIDFEEMKQGWERLGFEFDDEQAQIAFNLVDTDRSGHISKSEFCSWVEDFLLTQFIESQPVPSVPSLNENSTVDDVIVQFPFPSILKRKTIEKLTQFLHDDNALDFRMVLDKNERYALHVWTSTIQNFTTFALRAHAYDVTNTTTNENDIETHSTAKSTVTKKTTTNVGGTVIAPEDNRVFVIEKLDKRTVQSLNQLRPKLQPACSGIPIAFCASPALIAFYKTSAASNRFSALFEQVADKTGLLSLDGMQKFAKDYHLALSPSQVKFTFFSFDADRDHYLNQQDLELLLRSLVDCSSFDESNSNMPFTSQRGSLNQKEESQPLLSPNGYQTFDKSLEDEEEEDDDEDDDEDHDAELDKMSFAALVRTAFTYIIVGTLVVLLFSDPFVDVLVEVGVKLKIDAFYISFLISPLASNASEFVSSLKFAMKKTDISLGMTLSSLFGAATMNNTLALSIFCGLIYFRNLPWENSAECITLLCTITLVGLLSRNQTYPLWKAMALFSLLPISLAMIYVLNNHVKL